MVRLRTIGGSARFGHAGIQLNDRRCKGAASCLGETSMSLRKTVLLTALVLSFGPLPVSAQAPNPPAAGQLPPDLPPPPPKATPQPNSEGFGEETTLVAKTIVYLQGSGNWDSAYETLVQSFKTLYAYLDKEGLKPSGPSMTV